MSWSSGGEEHQRYKPEVRQVGFKLGPPLGIAPRDAGEGVHSHVGPHSVTGVGGLDGPPLRGQPRVIKGVAKGVIWQSIQRGPVAGGMWERRPMLLWLGLIGPVWALISLQIRKFELKSTTARGAAEVGAAIHKSINLVL